ncbi:MAG: 23S rRNA (pseudouridine(1915)-N(3))-methyltransferase RlmH [Longimicrobiales bacterium]
MIVVGRAGRLHADAIGEYERRARRYWNLDIVEVREERARKGLEANRVRAAEGRRLLERVPAGAVSVALTRQGEAWSSEALAAFLQELAVGSRAGAAFLIGGALGLAAEILETTDRRLSLGPLTLPHELARLLLSEQLYRAGTIVRGEPYHKGPT